ncbi:SNF2 family N-terminal domain-containing protein [Trichoderma barbatum]
METPVTAEPASPPAYLPTPIESPKANPGHPEECDLSGLVLALQNSDGCTSANAEQDITNFLLDSTTPTEANNEGSLFVGCDTMAEDEKPPHIHENEADGTEDELPLLEDLLDPEVSNMIALSRQEGLDIDGDNTSEHEDDDSDYEDDGSPSDDDHSDKEPLNLEASDNSSIDKVSRKPSQKRATTAREYIARLHKMEKRKVAKKMQREKNKKSGVKPPRKRKGTELDTESSKALKTANGHRLLLAGSSSSNSHDNLLPPAESIKAKTHAAQFAQLLPQNGDTRRKGTQGRDLREAVSMFGYKKVEAYNGDWVLKGMKTPLKSHQLTAVAWMVQRELALDQPFGGILADAMGMGKTIMSLACMLGNEVDDEHLEKFCNATLVVVPNKTIAQQWQGEAGKHCMAPYKHMVIIYDKQRENLREVCRESFIVIVTYKELISQYPDNTILRALYEKYGSDDTSIKRELDKIVGTLFRINWYRIILDEAHAIKNAESRNSKACCALLGKYRWALSGTPLANSSDEMYPYMKFLNCEETLTHKDFRSKFFHGVWAKTMDDEFLGRQIISLPERKEVDLWVSMSKEEQAMVEKTLLDLSLIGMGDMDENEDDDHVEELQNEKKGGKKSKSKKRSLQVTIWMLARASQVRQRQTISHVFCIERLLRHQFLLRELANLRSALEEIGPKQTILEQMQLGVEKDEGILRYQKGLQMMQEREESFFGKYFDMEPLLDILGEEHSVKGVICLLCGKANPPVDPVFSYLICPYEGCNEKLGMGDDIETFQKIIDKAEADGSTYVEPAKDSKNVAIHQEDNRNGFFTASMFLDDIPILPSTKLTAAMAVVLTWLDEAPDDKILIFTQFTGSAKMLGLMLQTLKIRFVYFYGGLATVQKSRALNALREDAEIKVMVATLKSGGQSLNLTVANRVIIIDPWWNKTAEQQAFGRVVRIGQTKVTHLVNIKTKEPIDSRIYGLQKKKARDVDSTLQDDRQSPPQASELELKKAYLRKKAEQEQKKNARSKAAKKTAPKASHKKKV